MKLGQYIYAKLSATSAVTALVGTRIYPVFVPEDSTYPAIVFTVTNQPTDDQKERKSDHDTAQVTFTYWAEVKQGADAYAALDNVDLAVRNALDFVTGTAGGVTVEGCKYVSSADGMDENIMFLSRTAVYQFITAN
ncbi:MAG TPA: DUF3168 domain-containing protein [Rheinheimera sp.]|nr:DUF3168 domain-containing protein [Rheinheimera sp.]